MSTCEVSVLVWDGYYEHLLYEMKNGGVMLVHIYEHFFSLFTFFFQIVTNHNTLLSIVFTIF